MLLEICEVKNMQNSKDTLILVLVKKKKYVHRKNIGCLTEFVTETI